MKKESGYVQDVTYPAHFHKEMQPVWLGAMTRFLGQPAFDVSAPFSWCELGCGVGINLLVAAACHPQAAFVGVDFNQQHLAVAREAAASIGLSNVRFIQADFTGFHKNNNLYFDVVVSHGVWSWIAPLQQQAVLQLVQQFLKPRGLLYLHYMCHPGATAMLPVQKLLNEVAYQQGGTAEQNIEAGLALLQRLNEGGAFIDQPGMGDRIQVLAGKGARYLAHDYLSDYWRPQHSADMHRLLAQAGVSFLGSADPFDNLERLSIPGNLQPVLAGIDSPALRETVKDLAHNQHQRRDLFLRGPQPLSEQEHLQQLDAMSFALLPDTPRAGGVEFATPIGNIQGPEEVFSPLLQALAAQLASFAELRQLPQFVGNPGLLSQSLQMLMWNSYVHPLHQAEPAAAGPLTKLDTWMQQHDLALQLVADCATAVHTVKSNNHD